MLRDMRNLLRFSEEKLRRFLISLSMLLIPLSSPLFPETVSPSFFTILSHLLIVFLASPLKTLLDRLTRGSHGEQVFSACVRLWLVVDTSPDQSSIGGGDGEEEGDGDGETP